MFNILLKSVLFFCAFGICTQNSFATIIVSGDCGIAESIDPTFPVEYKGQGNDRFFLNVLRNSPNVAIVKKEADRSLWDPTYLYCLDYEETIINGINSFYNTSAGITSSVINTVDASALEGVGLLVIPLPASIFAPYELEAMKFYVENGGSVFFLGDSYLFFDQNAIINQTLLGIGSTLNIAEYSGWDPQDWGPRYTTSDQTIPDAYTQGVQSLYYDFVSEVKGGAGRVAPLLMTQEGGVVPFIAYERPLSVPEPPVVALLFISLPPLLVFVRKRKK
jgi:hypothetical protein